MQEMDKVGCKFMSFDILAGYLERIISVNPAFAFLTSLGWDKVVFGGRRSSSYSTKTNNGTVEHFEKLKLNVKLLFPTVRLFRKLHGFGAFFGLKFHFDSHYFDFLDGEYLVKKQNSEEISKNTIPPLRRTDISRKWKWSFAILSAIAIGIAFNIPVFKKISSELKNNMQFLFK